MGSSRKHESWEARRRWFSAAAKSALRRYPRAVVESIQRRGDPHHMPASCLRHIEERPFAAAWLGHASVLARLGGTTALIDPVLSPRIGLRVGKMTFGPRRLSPAPVSPEGLPTPEVICITHAHFDHLDRPTLAALANSRTTVITAPGTKRLIPRGYKHIVELSLGERLELDRMAIRALEPAHWGARAWMDRRRGVNAYLASFDDRRTALFAGDTALTEAFKGLGPIDLAVFGVGAYDPWEHAHATPEQVWSMFEGLPGKRLLPVHHSTFELSDEHIDEPMARLVRAAGTASGSIIRMAPGEVWTHSDDDDAHSAGSAP